MCMHHVDLPSDSQAALGSGNSSITLDRPSELNYAEPRASYETQSA